MNIEAPINLTHRILILHGSLAKIQGARRHKCKPAEVMVVIIRLFLPPDIESIFLFKCQSQS